MVVEEEEEQVEVEVEAVLVPEGAAQTTATARNASTTRLPTAPSPN